MKLLNYEALGITDGTGIAEIPYGVRMIGAPSEWKETKGKGIKVAVLDTGKPEHQDLKIVKHFTAQGLQHLSNDKDKDYHGHATHVCGTIGANGVIKGVAPEASLYTAKVLDDLGQGSDDCIAQGIEWAIKENIDVISMSLGSKNPLPKTHEAVNKAVAKGIIVVCAAGNSGEDWMGYPAKYPETIAVAAIDIEKAHPDFSSVGEEVEVCAAGVNILSTWPDNLYRTLMGTSMACPHISGAVAIILAKGLIRYNRFLTPEEVRLQLHMNAEDLGLFGKDKYYGYGCFSFDRLEEKITVTLQIGSSQMRINNTIKDIDVAPFTQRGRTYTPTRHVAEAFGATVGWDEKTQTVTMVR